ncbi:hypothetical protein P7C71_g5168, partial [Lecanoromycetidae sp. Uapishka_2]
MASTNTHLSPAASQSNTEATTLPTSAVTDWVQQQSTVTRRAQMITPPPYKVPTTQNSTQGRARRKVYDIPTLLRLKAVQCAVPVMLRVKPEAIAGAGSAYFGHVIRQPIAPPRSSILQQHDGFVRFLKQHASPPHNRVTAGGRIVPAGPSSPPPMLDFDSLNTIVRDQTTTTRPFQKVDPSNKSIAQLQRPQSQPATAAATSGPYAIGQGYPALTYPLLADTLPAVLPFNNVTSGYQPIGSPMPLSTTAMVPIATLADGSTLQSYNGINYRAYWNGVTMVLEPLHMLPLANDQSAPTTRNGQAQSEDSMFRMSQPSQAAKLSLPFTSILRASGEGSTSQTAGSSEEDLKSQLTNLDKYLALYHYEITPAEKAACVTQRRCLVEEIDKIRVSKEQTQRGIPIIEPTTGARVVPVPQISLKPQAKPKTPSTIHGTIQKFGPVKNVLCSKGLSPAAPAFVPQNQYKDPSNTSNLSGVQQQGKQALGLEIPASRLRNHAPFNLQDVTKAAISRKDKALHNYDLAAKDNTHRHASSSSVLDPSDPAMRVIDYEDIEYAERYLYNWSQDTKTYCTTVAEFQEAIRRVREQARMYGCEGGQSKDPAYDAEQDIWWAICDRDPIPLPSKVPDHIANPRPWNWNDSAFNYRREGAPWPGSECDKARNSPRLAGWDPVITEAMKDKTDVSRSYFALKGQLPSVPFRDFAFDRHGNKVKIESGQAIEGPDVKFSSGREDTTVSSALKAANATQVASMDNNALRDLSASKLNGRNSSPIKPGYDMLARKLNLSDGDAIERHSQSAVRHSQSKDVQSTAKANPSINHFTFTSDLRTTDIKVKDGLENTQPNVRRCQSVFEECYDTPAARHTRADSKGSPTLQAQSENKTPGPHEDLKPGAQKAQPSTSESTHKKEYVSYSVPGELDKPIDVNDPWYGPPTDPVTLEYLARLRMWCPGDPDVLEVMAAEQKRRAKEDEILASRAASHKSAADITGPKHNPSRNTCDLSAETRSPWGPEQGSPFESCQRAVGLSLPEPNAATHSSEAGKTAKVNIPNAKYKGVLFNGENPTMHAGNSGRHGPGALANDPLKMVSQPKNDSHHFLRKMLKSPTFTSAQAFRFPTRMSSKLANTVNVEITSAMRSENSIFSGAAKLGPVGKEVSPTVTPSSSTPAFKSAPSESLNKAQSSLASSSYQAQGYLPQFGGATKAYAASLYGDRIDQAPHSPVRVNLPPQTSYDEKGSKSGQPGYPAYEGTPVHNISINQNTPVNFGFDGGADAPSLQGAANSSNDPNFDYKGVTVADYEIQRPDPESSWHQGEVEDFFQDLAKAEETEILSHRRIDTQSAA